MRASNRIDDAFGIYCDNTVVFSMRHRYRLKPVRQAPVSFLSEAADVRFTTKSPKPQAPSPKPQAVGCAVNNFHAAPVAIWLARSSSARRSVLAIASLLHPKPPHMCLVAALRPSAKTGWPHLSGWSRFPSPGCVRRIANPFHGLRLGRPANRRATDHGFHRNQLRTDDDLRNFDTRKSSRFDFKLLSDKRDCAASNVENTLTSYAII